MMHLETQEFTVSPEIKQVTHYLNKAKRVAVQSIQPVFSDDLQVKGLNIRVEGPAKHLSYFGQLIQNAKLCGFNN
jgi:hypothetical protein